MLSEHSFLYRRGRGCSVAVLTILLLGCDTMTQYHTPDYPSVASAFRANDQAYIYYKKGDYSQAESLYQRALALGEKTLGPDHPVVAQSLNGLANVYHARGNYPQAEPLHQPTARNVFHKDTRYQFPKACGLAFVHQVGKG